MATENNVNSEEFDSVGQRSRRIRLLSILFFAVAIVVALVYSYQHFYAQYHESTEDAYVHGNLVTISPKVTGKVTKIFADEGDYVEKGQPLVQLDQTDAKVVLAASEAHLASIVRQTRGLYDNVGSYQAQVDIAQISYKQALKDYQRRMKLLNKNLVSKETVAHYQNAVASAKNTLIMAEKKRNIQMAITDNVSIALHPRILNAIATLKQAYLNVAYTEVKAPVSGYVAKRSVQVGQQMNAGTTMMVVTPLSQVWVEANFKENQLKNMRIGQPVVMTSDLYGGDVKYKGYVESMGIGTGSAFALLPAQNATGNWIKIIQRVPVRIALDKQNLDKYPLRIGVSMRVNVNLKDSKGLLLANKPNDKARYTTDIYNHELDKFHTLVLNILKANGIQQEQAQQAVTAEENHSIVAQ